MGCCHLNHTTHSVMLQLNSSFDLDNNLAQKPMSEWHQEDVQKWLTHNKHKELSQLKPIFHQHQISGLTLEKITKDQLITELNVTQDALCDAFLSQRDQFVKESKSYSPSSHHSHESKHDVTIKADTKIIENTISIRNLYNRLNQFNMDTVKTKTIDLREHSIFHQMHILTSVNVHYSDEYKHMNGNDEIIDIDLQHLTIIDTNHKVPFLQHLQSFASDAKLIIVYNKDDEQNARFKERMKRFLHTTYGVYSYISLDEDLTAFYERYPFLCHTNVDNSNNSNTSIIGEQIEYRYPSDVMNGKLYIGDWKHSETYKILNDLKITHVLNVCEEEHIFKIINVEYKHIKMKDHLDENLLDGNLNTAIKWIDERLESGACVLVHCQEGVSRSAAIIIGYLMYKNKWSFVSAKKYLQNERPCVSPNASFQAQLHKYQLQIIP